MKGTWKEPAAMPDKGLCVVKNAEGDMTLICASTTHRRNNQLCAPAFYGAGIVISGWRKPTRKEAGFQRGIHLVRAGFLHGRNDTAAVAAGGGA